MLPPPDYMPALITPFTRGGEIDTRAHTTNLRLLAAAGIDGFVIGGSNGEGPYLEPGERFRLVKAGRRRKSHFMIGIAAESTRVALHQVEEAIEGGADSILVMTPTTLTRGRDEAVLRFYKTIADTSTAPVFLYSVPSVTGYNLPLELVWRLSRHDNIVGMKDSERRRGSAPIDHRRVAFGLSPLLRVVPGPYRGDGNRLSRGHHRVRQLRPRAGASDSGRSQGRSRQGEKAAEATQRHQLRCRGSRGAWRQGGRQGGGSRSGTPKGTSDQALPGRRDLHRQADLIRAEDRAQLNQTGGLYHSRPNHQGVTACPSFSVTSGRRKSQPL